METLRMKDALVKAMLPHAAFDGWSGATLAAAARDLDLDPTLPARLFPGGASEVVAHFVGFADRAMAEDFAVGGHDGAGVGIRVFQAIRLRLERWADHREAIRRATSLLSLPQNLPLALRLTWGTSDAVWHVIGDRSHDFSWYTKRATLGAVYSATLLYWLDDASEDSADSWAFLRRRLDDVRNIPKLRERVEGLMAGGKLGGLAARFKAPARRWGMPG
ncbi:MAG: COQ9 family protein [Phaeospirillum sp.]|nr:COQ9 family protein [Phaeospirillum sp.]